MSSFGLIGSALILTTTAMLPFPEWAERAVLAVRKVLTFLVRAAHVALAHRHGLDAVPDEEILHLLLDLRIARNVRGHPPLDDRLGTVMQDHSSSNLGRGL